MMSMRKSLPLTLKKSFRLLDWLLNVQTRLIRETVTTESMYLDVFWKIFENNMANTDLKVIF